MRTAVSLKSMKPITNLTIHHRAHMGIGYLPQEKSIFRKMTVAENIMSVLELRKDLNKQQRHETLDDLLHEFHLTQLCDVDAPLLSGGMQARRVSSSISQQPRLFTSR